MVCPSLQLRQDDIILAAETDATSTSVGQCCNVNKQGIQSCYTAAVLNNYFPSIHMLSHPLASWVQKLSPDIQAFSDPASGWNHHDSF